MSLDADWVIAGCALSGFIITIAGVMIKATLWLGDQLKQFRETISIWVEALETKFEERHIDNIERFAKLETKLDIVMKNGKH